MPLKRWLIPITIIEYGREAVIEAETLTEAIEKLRNREWEELTDADRFKVTKVGAAKLDTDDGGLRSKSGFALWETEEN